MSDLKKKFIEPKLKELDAGIDAYIKNPDVKQYVDKYCTRENISPEEACKHAMVKEVEKYYMQR